jgi:hypothetical protein
MSFGALAFFLVTQAPFRKMRQIYWEQLCHPNERELVPCTDRIEAFQRDVSEIYLYNILHASSTYGVPLRNILFNFTPPTHALLPGLGREKKLHQAFSCWRFCDTR